MEMHCNLFFVVLFSSNSVKLRRCIISLLSQNSSEYINSEILVVINTTREDELESGLGVAKELGVKSLITDSNGMPGRGKNSVFDAFLRRNQIGEYLVMIDGDDLLYPVATQILAKLVRLRPDAIGIQRNDIIDTKKFLGMKSIEFCKGWHLYTQPRSQGNFNALNKYINRFNMNRRLGQHRTPDRLVLFSFGAASRLRFPEEIAVFEDYAVSLQCRSLFLSEGFRYFNAGNTNIYVYDKSSPDSVSNRFIAENFKWVDLEEKFLSATSSYIELARQLHASEVPNCYVGVFSISIDEKVSFLTSIVNGSPQEYDSSYK